MASLFGVFDKSNLPKRLLRYALSRLDILETDELDLDKLDLTWGKNNVFTFHDVGIKLQKLERLLQLPSSFKLRKAKVLLLRITIPAAIYSSPIVVEVDGVQVKLQVASEETLKDEQKRQRSKKSAKAHHDEEVVPHPIDLAQSFLETQPSSEKAELQAALEAEKQDLTASMASSSEDGSEEDTALGSGQALSLPVFLADFLQGIVDRTQISIKGVTFELDVEVPLEVQSKVPEPVTFQLAIDNINVEGVTTQAEQVETCDRPAVVYKDGKRHVSLNKIRASLISEANVFSTLARSPSMPSSVTTSPPPTMPERQPLSRKMSMPRSVYEPLAGSSDLSQNHHHAMMDSEDAFNIPYDFPPSQEPEEYDLQSTPSTPRAPATQDSPPTDPLFRPSQSFVSPAGDAWAYSGRDVQSAPALEQLGDWGQTSIESEAATARGLAPEVASYASTPTPDEDLARSQMFSHEEAESMYMSAFSHAGGSEINPAMPGSWDSTPSSSDNSTKAQRKTEEALPSREDVPAESEVGNETVESPRSPPVLTRPLSPALDNEDNEGYSVTTPETKPNDVVATPRGPTRLVKEILSLSEISVYVPSTHKNVPVPSAEETLRSPSTTSHHPLERSIAPNVPGAFSVHGGAHSTFSPISASMLTPMPILPTEVPQDNSVEVILSPLDVRFDASISFLLAMVVSRILSVLKEPNDKTAQKAEAEKKKVSPSQDLKILAQKVSIHFLETLAGVADAPERILNPNPATFGTDALLTTTLQNLAFNLSRSESTTVSSIELEKFKFGYANDDIVSFDPRLQMRASVRDAFPSAGADVSIKVTQSPESTKCEVKTLPLHLMIDLQRLDETFSWFGGLSSFLNMGSSMTSSVSPSSRSPTRIAKKSRGVRFDAPIRADDKSAASENKINMRLGGFHLDLVGKDCSVSLDTSAVKLVTRDEGVGIGITKIQLSGPTFKRSMGDPPINADIKNIRIEYLVSPRDNDLERLLELILPSKHKFDDNDDEIMVDTLLRQRRKGAVLRLNCDNIEVKAGKLQQLQCLPALGEEIARLGTVAKYLPEDDRPGILTLALVRSLDINVDVDRRIGTVQTSLKDLEIGHINFPSLLALGLGSIAVRRNNTEELIGSTFPASTNAKPGPVLTLRMIPDALEPVIKLRMRHINIEYRVPTIMDALGLAEDATPQDFEAQLAASVANLGEQAHIAITGKHPLSESDKGKGKDSPGKPTKVDLVLKDCLLGLNPLGLVSKLVIVLTDAQLEVALSNGDDVKALGHLRKASVLLIDDVSMLDSPPTDSRSRRTSNVATPQIEELCSKGYVDICYISSANAAVQVGPNGDDGSKFFDVEIRDDLLVLETCADSTQTLFAIAGALAPPTPPSKEVKYRTQVMPVQDLLASISADAFGKAEGNFDFDDDFGLAQELGGDDFDFEESSDSGPLDIDSRYYDDATLEDQLADATDSMMSERTATQDTNDGVLLTSFSSQPSMIDDDEELIIHDNYFGTGSAIQGTAHRWNSTKMTYDQSNDLKVQKSPVTVRVRDVHVIWNLFDGYDWNRTRDTITKAVEDVETKAYERRIRTEHPRITAEMDAMIEEEETVIGDFLFNSIYIGIPANRDPRELAQRINQELNDNATETESIATTAMTATPGRVGGKRPKPRLRLNRSKRHKITFELKGINMDLVTFPAGSGETQSSIDVRIKDLDVFDHVPTSTWKKFATYDQDAGEREMGTSMILLELLQVKPVAELAASELVLKVTTLPLRLHVDQDALDFITRFFEFKDASAKPPTSEADVPFIQRAEVNSIPVKLDFKPKRVDYAGLRSGHTTEFMNFLILDESRLVLRHTIVYGVKGFDRLGKMLNDIWMPDVQRNQLPGVLAGLAPVRSLVNVGSGFKDLVEIPIREYKKDGRIVRSIGKGAAAFAKTTGTEIVKLSAKMAVGTQYILQGAEGMLVKQTDAREGGWEDEDFDAEETKQISLYADQPTGVFHGIRGAYSSLARDLNVARDAIIAVPGEVMESQTAQGAAKAVLKRAPTIIFRPLIGSSKALGKTLMGATNALDPHNRRRIEEKYKRH
ncbi:uncharacterized protein BCR38DRAFT_484422 [Pseudomassariella vexata]|uniref:Autophagy-related protein 2 n=1 Tax=Pseudomassariella vexata TaxID=1141098 RepID=A0A1Y2E0D8_9PEZI|nr:uncharacterized protein BCR38DRAFT_484422 [Pseudomassariella vexata]ORY64949.1 hypothetical protein BCR38DRAFT_484422 [Pseudomassariella vexata]